MTTEESPPSDPRGRPAAYEKGQGSCKICFAENRKEPCAAGYKGISKQGGGESPKLATRKAASLTAKEAIVSLSSTKCSPFLRLAARHFFD